MLTNSVKCEKKCTSQSQVWAARELVSIMSQILLRGSEFRYKTTCFFRISLYSFQSKEQQHVTSAGGQKSTLQKLEYNFAAYGKYYESVHRLILMPAKWSLHEFLLGHISLAGRAWLIPFWSPTVLKSGLWDELTEKMS